MVCLDCMSMRIGSLGGHRISCLKLRTHPEATDEVLRLYLDLSQI